MLPRRFEHFVAAHIAVRNLTVVADVDEAFEALCQRVVVVAEFGIVDDQRIEVVARFETTDFAEETATAFGSQLAHFGQREKCHLFIALCIMKFRNFDSIDHHLEHR